MKDCVHKTTTGICTKRSDPPLLFHCPGSCKYMKTTSANKTKGITYDQIKDIMYESIDESRNPSEFSKIMCGRIYELGYNDAKEEIET